MQKCGVTATHFVLHPEETLMLTGTILPNCKEFQINLGQDCDNLALHFNPRFDSKGDVNALVCNSRKAGNWEEEVRPSNFPFNQCCEILVAFTFTAGDIRVRMEGSEDIVFPNRLGLNLINYLEVTGDFRTKSLIFP